MDTFALWLVLLSSVACLALAGPWLLRRGHAAAASPPATVLVAAPQKDARAEIEAKLRRLADSPAPPAKQLGAMCYEPRAVHDHAEYVCPKDGERTRYGRQWAENVEEIGYLRQRVRQIKGLELALDEHEFCKTCNPGLEPDGFGKGPALVLVVRYPDAKTGKVTEHRTRGVGARDIQLIEELLAGSLEHGRAGPDTEPLKKHLARLEELLGVRVTVPDAKSPAR